MHAVAEGRDLTRQRSSQTTEYECDICRDMEWLLNSEGQAYPCKCREVKRYRRILEASEISSVFRELTFDNFKERNETVSSAKRTAMRYAHEFESVRGQRNNSIAFLGKPGAGKTHLSIAIANVLMSRMIGVLYMPYREAIIQLKQCIMDEQNYQREMDRYKKAPVLLMDDLYKGKITETDLNIIFEIINHRYLKGLPVIVSSEKLTEDLIDFDEATGSRIIEMCKGRIREFTESGLNYRLT